MKDKTLKAHLLRSEFIIKNFINGETDCNYEKYMLEFINESTFFQTKSEGEVYKVPHSEEHGECDCISDKYQLDFKLIASKTALQARSILSYGKTVVKKGVVITETPKVCGKSMQVTRIHAALRGYNFDELCELREKYTKKQGIENDIYELLETLETKKNLMLFFPYKFTFDNEHDFLDGVEQIREAVNNDFQYAMQYRKYVANDFDTYMAFVFDGYIVFMEEKNSILNFADRVELSKSSVYRNLSRYGECLV